jgi:hypothetical protein
MERSNTPFSVRKRSRPDERRPGHISYSAVHRAALTNALELCHRLLPGGRRAGNEYLALNPKRADRSVGSFRINLKTGRWADFATSDRGGDFVSLVAWLYGLRQSEAAVRLASLLNIRNGAGL